jgi:outer membrane protein assembly factor BamC
MRFSAALLPVFMLATLVACSNSSEKLYGDAKILPDLEVPPDLMVDKSESIVELPEVFTKSGSAGNIIGKQNSVLLEVDTISLEGNADFYWLVVDADVEDVYQLVKNFWAAEGFNLAVDEPVIGIMETEWIHSKQGTNKEASFLGGLFGEDDLSAIQDQYKSRIGRDAKSGETLVYITHRGTEYSHVLATKSDDENGGSNEWGFRASDAELEIEMLSRLMIFLGLEQPGIENQLAKTRLLSPRASVQIDYSENETYLMLKGEYTRNWNRTLHQLERLNFEVLSADIRSGLSDDGVMLVETNIDTTESNSGFFSFGGDGEVHKKQVYLVFSEETHELTRISIEDTSGDIDTSPEAVEFLTLLSGYLE